MKKIIIAMSEPFFWEEWINILQENGLEVKVVKNLEELDKSAEKDKFDFAIVHSTMYGRIPKRYAEKYADVNEYIRGIMFGPPILEEKNIPYLLSFVTEKEGEEADFIIEGMIGGKAKMCIGKKHFGEFMPGEMILFLKEKLPKLFE